MEQFSKLYSEYKLALEVSCPICDAHRGQFCFDRNNNFCPRPHLIRLEKAKEKGTLNESNSWKESSSTGNTSKKRSTA